MEKIIYLAVVTGACMGASVDAGEVLTCPASLSLASAVIQPDSVPAEFQPVVPQGLIRLSGSNMFDGPPENAAALIPNARAAKPNQSTWVFEGVYPAGKWFSCDYAGGLFRLAKKLQEPVALCRDTVIRTPPSGTLNIQLICK